MPVTDYFDLRGELTELEAKALSYINSSATLSSRSTRRRAR